MIDLQGASHEPSDFRMTDLEECLSGDAFAGVNLRLAVERQVIAIFGCQQMCNQARIGLASLDRQ